MKRLTIVVGVIALVSASVGLWAQGPKRISELLSSYEEVPALSTAGVGEFHARISNDQTQIEWELEYSDLQGDILQSHIHFGQAGVSGGISVFLCTNLGNGPVGTQACPAAPATISGTWTAASVIGPAAQGIAAGQFDELVRAIRAGATYVNVHTSAFTGGEIRAQINPGGRGQGAHDH